MARHFGQFQFGTHGDDEIFGNDTFNFLFGFAGNDTITGGSHRDFIFGGRGDDVIYGLDGPDYLRGGGGDDQIYAGDGDDTLIGGCGNDSLDGSYGSDRYEMGAGNDEVLCLVTGAVAADFIRSRGDFDQIIQAAQGAYDQAGIDVDLSGRFAAGNPGGEAFAEYFADFTIGEDILNIQQYVPWLFTIAQMGVLGQLEDLNGDGNIAEGDVLLKLIDAFLKNTMSFGEAKDAGLIGDSVQQHMEANGLEDDDCVFLPNQIGADEVWGFSGVDATTFQEKLFAAFDFGLTPSDFGNFNLTPDDIATIGQANGVELDLTGFA